jgi:hypothetical protein
MTFNSLRDGMLSTGFSGHQLQSIDPQLLHYEQELGEQTGLFPLSHNASLFAAVNANFDTASCRSSQMIFPNDFDIALEDPETALGVKNSGPGPLSYLVLWSLLNPGRLPSAKELKCLEHLAQVPAKQIMTWLKKHMSVTSTQQLDALQGSEVPEYRPKCLNSRQRKTLSGEPRLYECTHRCGQTFSKHRKGDWERHERINFEDWVCSVCDHVLGRKEHLQKHLKAVHNIEGTKLENQKRQLLDSMDRPCGFCCKKFFAWVAWLGHVAAHFEGSIGRRKRKMSEWKEQMISASSSAPSPKRSISHGGITGDDEDENDDSDGDNGDGGDGNNSGSNALNSSRQPSHIAGGSGQGHTASYGPGFPQATFDGYSKDTTLQTTANFLGAPSLRHTDSTNIASDDTQEILQSFAALDVSTITNRSTPVVYSRATNSAEFPTDANTEPHVSSDPHGFRGRAGTSARHTHKRSIDGSPPEPVPNDPDKYKSRMMASWLGENPRSEPWNPLSRAGSGSVIPGVSITGNELMALNRIRRPRYVEGNGKPKTQIDQSTRGAGTCFGTNRSELKEAGN